MYTGSSIDSTDNKEVADKPKSELSSMSRDEKNIDESHGSIHATPTEAENEFDQVSDNYSNISNNENLPEEIEDNFESKKVILI